MLLSDIQLQLTLSALEAWDGRMVIKTYGFLSAYCSFLNISIPVHEIKWCTVKPLVNVRNKMRNLALYILLTLTGLATGQFSKKFSTLDLDLVLHLSIPDNLH